MASPDIQGIKLTELSDHIVTGLRTHTDNSYGRVEFDVNTARVLSLTPEKRNAARSESVAKHLGNEVGKLIVIAFRSGDGTGDPESLGIYPQAAREVYMRVPQAAPRSKAAVHAEVLLPLVQYNYANANPIVAGGDYRILGLDSNREIIEIGSVHSYLPNPSYPKARVDAFLTCGYPDELKGGGANQRYGDPHAIYAQFNGPVQVAAFLAVNEMNVGALIDLKTQSNLIVQG